MAAQLLLNQLPEPLQQLYTTYYAPYQSYLHPIVTRTFYLFQSVFFKYLYPTGWAIYSVVNRLTGGNTADMSVATLFFTVLSALVGLWLLNAARRRVQAMILSMMSMAVWLVIWAGALTIVASIYYRGFEQTANDLINIGSLFLDSQEKGQRKGAGKARQREWEAKRTGRRV